jgi:hypothetical protein
MRERMGLAGVGLLAASLVLAVVLDRLVATGEGGRLVLVVLAWAQQVSLVLGAGLVVAGAVLRRLAPQPPTVAAGEPGIDWYG